MWIKWKDMWFKMNIMKQYIRHEFIWTWSEIFNQPLGHIHWRDLVTSIALFFSVVENDAFHQIRCKLFFKKGSEWKELGIGMLYLKPGSDENKIQLLVRMETTTGKVLLNVTVTNDTPTSRSGKNNVMVVTIPNPPVFTKKADGDNSLPCTYLIRVKGTSEADELFGKLKKWFVHNYCELLFGQ